MIRPAQQMGIAWPVQPGITCPVAIFATPPLKVCEVHYVLEGNIMVTESVGALHVALAAAVVGWLVFCISHSLAVWKKRNASGDTPSSRGLLFAGLLLCAAALAAGWLDRELMRRAGVIMGTVFFVVRAHARTIPHLAQGDSIDNGATLATFDDPEGERQEANLKGEIVVLEKEIASTQLKPLDLDPELLRLSQNAIDTQRARLSQLGYGVLRPAPANPASVQALEGDELVAAQRAKSEAADTNYKRTAALVEDGIVARAKLEPAQVAAQTAAQELRERQNLIEAARLGSDTAAQTESAVIRDGERAKAERTAELAELNAKLSEFRTSLLQFHQENIVIAPFSGTVVYRNPTPALAAEGKVILALAKGPGFLATVQVPTREAAMLEPGQKLRMKLKHSLVSEEISGRLQSVRPVSGYPDRRDLLIECELPREQFATFTSGSIPVTLQWRPPLYTDRVAQGGLVFSLVPMIAWLFNWVGAKFTRRASSNSGEPEQDWSKGWSCSEEEAELLHQLGIKLGDDLKDQEPSPAVLKQVERAFKKQPATSDDRVPASVLTTVSHGESAIAGAAADSMRREVGALLAQFDRRAQNPAAIR
jgi:multidrug resistance efflux pump